MSGHKGWLIRLGGIVQGVGCRPKIKQMATQYGLFGWVRNLGNQVEAYCVGDKANFDLFVASLNSEYLILNHEYCENPLANLFVEQTLQEFKIVSSEIGQDQLMLTTDAAPCKACLSELLEPSTDANQRRFGYPFISCCECGPRYSIAHHAPFDRANTDMDLFHLCSSCQEEFSDPNDRRYHAQTISCPECGPQFRLLNASGELISGAASVDAMASVVMPLANSLENGDVIAIKTSSGFQLICSANNERSVARLRELKQRDHKPFAVMVKDIDEAEEYCCINVTEAKLLSSAAAPLVIMKKLRKENHLRDDLSVGDNVAPDNPYLALMLPSHPIYHLLLQKIKFPLVVTSANRSGGVIAGDEDELLQSFAGEIDLIASHDLPITRVLDDSIFQVVGETPMCLRAGRGVAPVVYDVSGTGGESSEVSIGLGAELKNTLARYDGSKVVVSHYHGDLESISVLNRQVQSMEYLTERFDGPSQCISDLHPHSQRAEAFSGHIKKNKAQHLLQHHEAHARAVQLEFPSLERHLAVVWDGFGWGADEKKDGENYWGSEFFLIDNADIQSVGHFASMALLGGDFGMKEPRRMALSALWPAYEAESFSLLEEKFQMNTGAVFSKLEKQIWQQFLSSKENGKEPMTYTRAMGRWFDAVSAMLGLIANNRYEGDAAMRLQYLAETATESKDLTFEVFSMDDKSVFDPTSVLSWLLSEEETPANRALGFHNALANTILFMACKLDVSRVSLSGGCFQNKLLVLLIEKALAAEGIKVFWPQKMAINDGNIAAGQVYDSVLKSSLLTSKTTGEVQCV